MKRNNDPETTAGSSMSTDGFRVEMSEWRAGVPTVLALLVVAILVGAKPTYPPSHGLEPSWQTALSLAHLADLDFGTDIVFTYGPLGFAEAVHQASFRWSVVALGLNLLLSWLALTAVYLSTRLHGMSTRMAWSTTGACALFLLLSSATNVALLSSATNVAVVAGVFVLALSSSPGIARSGTYALLAAGGGLAALAVAVKFTGVVLVVVLGLVAILESEKGQRWRRAGVAVGSFLGGLIAIWLLLGQPVEAIPAFMLNSFRVAAGFVDMSTEHPSVTWGYPLLVASAPLILHMTLSRWRDRPGWSLSIVAIVYFAARQGFVRHDSHQDIYFSWLVPVIILLLLVHGPSAPTAARRLPLRHLGLGAVALVSVIGFYGTRIVWVPGWIAEGSQRTLHLAMLAVDSGLREREQNAARDAIKAEAAIPPEIAKELATGAWHAEPIDVSVLWAYGAKWSPLPVIQSYSAYSAYLDELNGSALVSAAPRILERQHFAIDGRNPLWESPRARVEMACRYSRSAGSNGWQILDPAGTSCSNSTSLGEPIRVSTGTPVPVPELMPGPHLLLMVVEVEDPILERLTRLVWKDYRPVYVASDTRRNRLPRGHLGAELIVCGNPGFGFAPPVDNPCPDTITLDRDGTIEFRVMTRS